MRDSVTEPGTDLPAGAGSPARCRRRQRSRLQGSLRPAAITALAAAAALVGATACSSSAQHPAAQQPAITKAQARQVLSHFIAVGNETSGTLSASQLATIEGGSSYSLDAGNDADYNLNFPGTQFPAFKLGSAAYYLPDQSAQAPYPHWFAVRVTDANHATEKNALPQNETWTTLLLFSQASHGAAWLDVYEPVMLSGAAAPAIATVHGYAIAVSPEGSAARLSTAAGQIASQTAQALDYPGTEGIKLPSNLSNLEDEYSRSYWQSYVGKSFAVGTTVTLTHTAGSGPVFGLKTTNGGAILFYYLNAQVSVSPPAGGTVELRVPGFTSYAPYDQVPFIDQFAAYDPPKGHGAPRIIADQSGYAAVSS